MSAKYCENWGNTSNVEKGDTDKLKDITVISQGHIAA
jgi:hypothetical protein